MLASGRCPNWLAGMYSVAGEVAGPAAHRAGRSSKGKPVVVVPPHAQPPDQISRILVPLEGTSESSRALDDTIELAHRRAGGERLVARPVDVARGGPGDVSHDVLFELAGEDRYELAVVIVQMSRRHVLARSRGLPREASAGASLSPGARIASGSRWTRSSAQNPTCRSGRSQRAWRRWSPSDRPPLPPWRAPGRSRSPPGAVRSRRRQGESRPRPAAHRSWSWADRPTQVRESDQSCGG